MSYTPKQILIMRDAYDGLGEMVTAFNKPLYDPTMTDLQISNYIGKYLIKAMRDFGIDNESFDNAIDYDDKIATLFTNRIEYYMIKDFRYQGSVMYKFSSSKDGFTVEKQVIFKNLNELILQLEDEYNREVIGNYHHGLWTMSSNGYSWADNE